jgi:hypothetical protein
MYQECIHYMHIMNTWILIRLLYVIQCCLREDACALQSIHVDSPGGSSLEFLGPTLDAFLLLLDDSFDLDFLWEALCCCYGW